MEEESKKHRQQTESEVLQVEEDKGKHLQRIYLQQLSSLATTRRAKHLMEEQLDDVKQMNQMMLYAQCVAVRDKQVIEKKQAEAEEKRLDRCLDDLMEQDRQKAIQQEKVSFFSSNSIPISHL